MKKNKRDPRLQDGFDSVVKQGEPIDAAPHTGENGRDAADMDKAERFRALIEGEYKEEFRRAVSEIVRRRLRESADAAVERDRLRADRELLQEQLRERIAHCQAARWQREEAAVRMQYPSFVLRDELADPDFVRLLTDRRHPMAMLRAYESIHFEELRDAIEQKARARAEEELRLRRSRPNESGAAPQAGIPQHAPMTRREREELAKRALRGEKIVL
ncbi:MAG: hypothetical protein IJD20_03820 [Oscillospiraceae bacterium]|nr:hypothetical protein [Oscillospiraceae bacterium]